MPQSLPKKIGWVGLGLMGYPMATNLLKKMEDAEFYVYDVVQDSIDKFVKEGNGRVHACASSKEVADKSVCLSHLQCDTRVLGTTYGGPMLTGAFAHRT